MALEVILIIVAILFGIICAKLPYQQPITNHERMEFKATLEKTQKGPIIKKNARTLKKKV